MHSLWIDLHDFCVIWMTAVIWLVQVLVYPNFRLVADSDFKAFHKRHCDRISFLVAPMIAQGSLSAMILYQESRTPEWIFHFSAIVLIFIITASQSAPAHAKLSLGKNHDTIERLIAWNWVRTLLWTAELIAVLVRHMGT
jgi:hypothetical protein